MNNTSKISVPDAIKAISPIITLTMETSQSGIYLYKRTDEQGITWFYVGQAKNIFQRQVSHWMGFRQHLDFSIRKRGFKSDANPYGWQFEILVYCPKENLNEREQFYIMAYLKLGWQTYNKTFGSQGKGKISTDDRKPAKGYYDGLKQGRHNLSKELQKTLKYVVIAPKDENKRTIRMYNKFLDLLTPMDKGENDDGENQTN